MSFDLGAIRAQFPILSQRVAGRPLVWLDSAATTQKPFAVLDAMDRFLREDNANVHRGVHALAARATKQFDDARKVVAAFIGGQPNEVIFTRGTTEAINLVANAWGGANLRAGDEIVLSGMEHHSGIVPWQMAAERAGAKIVPIPLTDRGELDMDAARRLIGSKTRVVQCVHVSNALGTVNPIAELAALAHAQGAILCVDGAQALAHVPVDVNALGADFYAFSGHKVYAPTGIGGLWGRSAILDAMPPWQGGGDMIRSVTFEKTTYAAVPARFEAGTPNVIGVIGLAAALRWFSSVFTEDARIHEHSVLEYGTARLAEIDGLQMQGTAPGKVAILAFTVKGVHPHDIGTIVDRRGVAIRTGHHCAQPVMQRFGVPATARASLAIHNGNDDVDALAEALDHTIRMLRK